MSETTRHLRGIVLTVSERCNLRCDYCYVPVERGRTMPDKVVDQAVDWFVANAADAGTLDLSFFGGEPFLATRQMRRATSRLRGLVPPDRGVHVTTPTNALAMSEQDVAWCRQQDIELAISIDGGPQTPGRKLADGEDCAGKLADVVPELLRKLPPGSTLARMTVTPANVGSLCANIRTLARYGFERIVYLPDYDARWNQTTLLLWRREHERLVTWVLGARSAGKQVPELPAWKAIEARLRRGLPRRRCGAGVDQVTVTPDGGLFPCYRFPYAQDAEAWRLGNVSDGITHPERIALLERLDANRLQPERGACASCPAADGCTHHCPALGFLASGDVSRVPETACRLMEAQVAAVRELCAAVPRTRRAGPLAGPLWAKAAMVAVAATGVAGCERHQILLKPDGGDANQTRDVGMGGGICAVQIDPDAPTSQDVASAIGDAAAIDMQAIDGEEADSKDAYVWIGGICMLVPP
jgi:radical SAM protein with 4Fe4S-binding SPASM domain